MDNNDNFAESWQFQSQRQKNVKKTEMDSVLNEGDADRITEALPILAPFHGELRKCSWHKLEGEMK